MNVFKHHYILKIRSLVYLYLTFISCSAFAQIFASEQNPLSVKWRVINSSGFKLIYPEELENEAQRMANTIPQLFPFDGASLGVKKTRLPILFQNQGVIANGFVQLGPMKSEFNTTPPQQFDSQDWLNNLAVHELRHAAQFDLLTSGRSFPFPENIYFAWMGASIPLWFFEGDAVSMETSLTLAGRGRQPSWIMPYRTTLLSGKKISYSKANFGSAKDVTPGYYQLGYLMASNIRMQHGRTIFEDLLTDIKKRPFRTYPFSNSLKKFTGLGTHAWYKKTTKLLEKEWKKQDAENTYDNYETLNKPASFATDYFLPVALENGQVLALKESKSESRYFVLIDSNKKETKVLSIGYQEQPWYSYANGIIVWDEVRFDPRFRQRSYNVICSFNLNTRVYKKLSSRSRLFSPSISEDGKKLVAVQIDLSNKSNLVELETVAGKITFTYPNPAGLILQNPSYNSSGNLVTFIGVSEKGKSLWVTDKAGKMTQYIRETNQQLNKPIFMREGIVFNAHYSGLDNFYYLDTTSREISALSASKFGAFNPRQVKYSNQILFNNYSLYGFELATTTFKPEKIPVDNFVFFGKGAKDQENTWNVFHSIRDSNYKSEPYRQFWHLFNFHSVIPVVENDYIAGIQLQSNDLLNTTDFYSGVNYHRDLNRFEYNASVSFKSLYPVITTRYINRPRRSFYNTKTGVKQGDWRENFTELTAMVPINLNALNDSYSLSAIIGTNYTNRYMLENLPTGFTTDLRFPMTYGFSFNHSIRQAERDIAPIWGQILRLKYYHQPFDQKLPGSLFSLETFLYFPGLFRNHSFLANFNYQEATGIRRFNTDINTVYGYNNILAKSRLINTLLFNYRFPIAFPDAEVGPVAYLRNVRAGVFCHYENIGRETKLAEPKTYGFEIHSNMNLLRYEPVFDVGGRLVLVNKSYHQKPIFEFILNYSF
jgi:hypothetical protein